MAQATLTAPVVPLDAEKALLDEETAVLATMTPAALECRICAKTIAAGSTTMLRCCHTFCRDCVVKQIVGSHRTTDGALECPVCGSATDGVATAADVAKLPANPFAEAELAEHPRCQLCKQDPDVDGPVDAVVECATCGGLCVPHEGLHKTKKSLQAHQLTPLHASRGTPRCAAHARALEIFCTSCRTVCCTLCLVSAHPQPKHATVVLADHATDLRTTLASAHQRSVERRNEVLARLVGLRATLGAVDERSDRLKTEVRHAFSSLAQLLSKREQTLLDEVDQTRADECASLTEEQAADRRRWLALHGAGTVAEQLAAADSKLDHLGPLAGPVETHLAATARAVVLPAPPAALVEFVITTEVERVLETAGRFVYRQAYGPRCTAEGLGVSKAYKGTGGKFRVTAMTRADERVTTGGDKVTMRLVGQDANATVTTGTVVDGGNGVYDVSYAVDAVGEYRLHVDVNGRPIPGSPFTVTVAAARKFVFMGPPYYDNRGILYHLATSGGTRLWTNPHTAGVVVVTISSLGDGNVAQFVANAPPTQNDHYFYTKPAQNSWIAVSLKGQRVKPAGYVLSTSRNGVDGTHLLRTWRLEGSADGGQWTVLRQHTNDTTLLATNLTGYWPVDDQPNAFSHFRITLTSQNADGGWYLMATSFEVYGELFA